MLRNCFYFLLIFVIFSKVKSNCIFKSRESSVDLSDLDREDPWPAVFHIEDHHYVYYFSLCRPLQFPGNARLRAACNGSMTCREDLLHPQQPPEALVANVSSGHLDVGSAQHGYIINFSEGNFSAVFMMSCGPVLGSPRVHYTSKKASYMGWTSSAVCADPAVAIPRQIPCYVVDTHGRIRDLTPLVLTQGGGHMVDTMQPWDLIINVCSNIQPVKGDITENCTMDSPTCLISSEGKAAQSYGTLAGPPSLIEEDNTLELVYYNQSAVVPAGCRESPTTKIRFVCPYHHGKRQSPKMLLTWSKCGIIVEWVTDYACPMEMVKGRDCLLQSEEHGVDIDLRPLFNGDDGYSVNGTTKAGNNTTFHMRICSPSDSPWQRFPKCLGTAASIVCQEAGPQMLTVGATHRSELIHADGELYMNLDHGTNCSIDSKFATKITFVCDSSAGKGKPEFVAASECQYLFVWKTQLACPPHQHPQCAFTSAGRHFDLLQSSFKSLWPVMNDDDEISEILIHPCLPIMSHNLGIAPCPTGSSLCLPGPKSSLSVGSIIRGPLYNATTKAIEVEYGNGTLCGGKATGFLTMTCSQGNIVGSPKVDYVSADGCHYQFSWENHMACPLETIVGTDCWVSDKLTDQHFNLKKLASPTYYNVSGANTSYIINICQPIKNHSCSVGDTGVCKVPRNGKAQALAPYTSTVQYSSNGLLRLLYGDKLQLVLVCDRNAGKGSPRLVGSNNGDEELVMMEWKTAMACSNLASTCMALDEHHNEIFDLHRLIERSPYKIVKENREIYFSICRPLGVEFPFCDPEAGVCSVAVTSKGTMSLYSNMGEPSQTEGPVVQGEGHLMLKYDNGVPCKPGENMRTLIHILCPGEAKYEGWAEEIMGNSSCDKSILLMSSVVCSRRQAKQKKSQCQVVDGVSGTIIDLNPLARRGSLNATSYQVSFCASPEGGMCGHPNATVCMNGNPLALANSSLTEIHYQDLSLSYSGSKDLGTEDQKYEIKLRCPESHDYPHHLQFVRQHNQLTVFNLTTPLACVPKNPICSFVAENHLKYDLTPLAAFSIMTKDLEVQHVPNAHNFTDLQYTFCGALRRTTCEGQSSACLNPPDDAPEHQKGFNLGYQYHTPTVSRDGVVLVTLTGGDPCPSNPNHTASAVFHIMCRSTGSGNHNPLLVGVSKQCRYSFLMDSPYACPLKKKEIQSNGDCTVLDPRDDVLYDLRPLMLFNGSSYKVNGGLEVNVCGPVLPVDKLGTCHGAGACANSTNLGQANQDLVLNEGQLKLTYRNGDVCSKGVKRTTEILFACLNPTSNPSVLENHISVLSSNSHSCVTNLMWYTSLACASPEPTCSIGDFDFSPLILNDYKKPYLLDIRNEQKLLAFNLCRRVSEHGLYLHLGIPHNSSCKDSGACLLLPNNQTLSAGRASSLHLEGGTPVLRYTQGAQCLSNPNKTLSTWIQFECSDESLNSEGWGHPIFVWEEDCTYYLMYNTPLACKSNHQLSSDNCKIKPLDSKWGRYYNFQPLSALPKIVDLGPKHKFYLQICGNQSTSPCGPEVGSCEEYRGTFSSMGLLSSRLFYRSSYINLEYSGGQPCRNHTSNTSTLLEFGCSNDNTTSITYLPDLEDECTRTFLVRTPLACYTMPVCTLEHNGHFYDFGDKADEGAIHIQNPQDPTIEYLVSLCSPLDDNEGCPKGSGICLKGPSKAINLGRPSTSLTVSFLGELMLIYSEGDPCQDELGSSYRSKITFVCDPHDSLRPVVFNHTQCLYEFIWYTSSACNHEETNAGDYSSSTCIFSSGEDEPKYSVADLKPREPTSPYEISLAGSRKLLVSPCMPMALKDPANSCRGSTVCLVDGKSYTSLGKHLDLKWQAMSKSLQLHYENGSDCVMGNEGKGSSEIQFVCDPTAGLGRPVARMVSGCHARILWRTIKVCQLAESSGCIFNLKGRDYDLSPLSSYSTNKEVVDAANNDTYLINVCRKLNTNIGNGCRPDAIACIRKGLSSHYDTLAITGLQDVSLNEQNDIVMAYYGGDKCNDTFHSIEIFFKCGKELGEPTLIEAKGCVHKFEWKTYHACPEQEIPIQEARGTLFDRRILKAMDVSPLLNSSFVVPTLNHMRDSYIFYINLQAGGTAFKELEHNLICAKAGVCQTKNDSLFYRDIGSYSMRNFSLKSNSSILLTLTSLGKSCGKAKDRNVTSIFHLSCSEKDGLGKPEFDYESGHCHYMFKWDTNVVCPRNLRNMSLKEWEEFVVNGGLPQPTDAPISPPSPSSLEAGYNPLTIIAVVGVLFLVALPFLYILSSPERRIHASMRFKNLFTRVRMPKLLYRKGAVQFIDDDVNFMS